MKGFAIVSVLIFTAFGCSVKVSSIKAPNTDLSSYSTFCWIQGCDLVYQGPEAGFSPEQLEDLKQIIKTELESKGMVNDENEPDLLVGFHIILEEKSIVMQRPDEIFNPYDDRQITYWDTYDEYYQDEILRYLKGTLIIDLVDAASGRVVWQSTAHRLMENTQELSPKRMQMGVRKALKDFPSKTGYKL